MSDIERLKTMERIDAEAQDVQTVYKAWLMGVPIELANFRWGLYKTVVGSVPDPTIERCAKGTYNGKHLRWRIKP